MAQPVEVVTNSAVQRREGVATDDMSGQAAERFSSVAMTVQGRDEHGHGRGCSAAMWCMHGGEQMVPNSHAFTRDVGKVDVDDG